MERLIALADAYRASEHRYLFLFPDWIDAILAQDEHKLQQLLEEKKASSSKEPGSREIQWLHHMGALPSVSRILDENYVFAEKIFGGVLDG